MPDTPSPDPYQMVRALLRANRELTDIIEATLPKPVLKFVPTDNQQAVLDALYKKALRTDAIANKVGCNRRTLFRDPGGIPELMEEGLVSHHKRLGYYRPDAPPDDMKENATN